MGKRTGSMTRLGCKGREGKEQKQASTELDETSLPLQV